MSEPTLFNPDNRWLASSASNDLSLYGAQPLGSAVFARAPAAADAEVDRAPPGAAPAPAPGEEGSHRSSAAEAGNPVLPAPESAPPAPVPSTQAESPSSRPMTEAREAGAAAPSPIPLSGAPETAKTIPAQTAPEDAAVIAPAATFQAPLILSSADGGAPLSREGDVLNASLEATNGIVEVADLVPAAEAPIAPLLQATAPVLSILPDAAGSPITSVVEAAAPVLSIAPSTAAAENAEDDVQDLLGSDPAAGVATLVSLVSVSDVLDVQEASNDAGEKAEATNPELIDMLASDPPDAPDLLADGSDGGPPPGIVSIPAAPDPDLGGL